MIYGIGRLGTSGSADAGVSAIYDMRGQAGGNLLANYANRQEYKLARLRQEHRDEGETPEQDADATDEPKGSLGSQEHDALNAACMAIGGVLALGLSWLVRQIFAR